MGSLISGIGSYIGGQQAASADRQAAGVVAQQYQTTRGDMLPYIQAGTSVLPQLTSLATSGPYGPGGTNYLAQADAMQPPQMTQAQLEATPGYQFTQQQGLQAVQNSAAARGLGVSGASMRGAADYATGLANSTYKDQFNIAQQRFQNVLSLNQTQQGNLQNQFARLYQTSGLGEQAGASLGNIGAYSAAGQANALIGAGTAESQGTKGLATGIGDTVNQAMFGPLGGALGTSLSGSGATGGYSDTTSTF